ncbi:hypothetical protein C2S52_017646 [Perilla frutescens var. hirtella]|nr:hypothetical protein C2S52_017646 [Perilla frutescens var. hirtella]KAH6811416.1 hypothetical protein C2S51_025178 [Perilla frutescens var. frutescens]
MLLRSSSTPVLGSLLQSFSESPNNNGHHQSELHKHTPNSVHAKISCSNGGNQDFRKSLFHSSPSLAEIKGSGFRRAQSDGNLAGLADAASNNVDELSFAAKKSGRRNSCCTLEPIPSLSRHRLWTSFEDEDEDYDDEGIEEGEENGLGDDYNRVRVENLVLEKVGSNNVNGNGNGKSGLHCDGKMYLAAGIGTMGVDFGGGSGGNGGGRGSYRPVDFDRDGSGGGVSMEEHYKRMLEENPGDPLFLRNYAQFLYQIKGDGEAAEEYYSRAILADQEDGETLSQYAKIIWELHHDKDRAANYFERAVRVSSQSSHIHAAYASFLWDAEEEEEDEEDEGQGQAAAETPAFLHHGFMASATA